MKETSAKPGNSMPALCVIMVWLAGSAGDIVRWTRVLVVGYASPIFEIRKISCHAGSLM
jgi:hypothetical protein